jgi:hypothetical protein
MKEKRLTAREAVKISKLGAERKAMELRKQQQVAEEMRQVEHERLVAKVPEFLDRCMALVEQRAWGGYMDAVIKLDTMGERDVAALAHDDLAKLGYKWEMLHDTVAVRVDEYEDVYSLLIFWGNAKAKSGSQ